MTGIGLSGAGGHLGAALVRAIGESPLRSLSGGCERPDAPAVGRDLGDRAGLRPLGLLVTADAGALCDASDVVVDCSAASATMALLPVAVARPTPLLVRTTGFGAAERVAFVEAGRSHPGHARGERADRSWRSASRSAPRRRGAKALGGVMVTARHGETGRRRRVGRGAARASTASLLADPEVEVVYVALPNHLHVGFARKAAAAGKHVLVEKPVALTRAELAAFDGIDPRLRIAEAFMVRHQPRWQALRARLASGEHGEVCTVSSLLSFMMTREDDFRTRPEWGGGAIYDLGCYTAMAARFVFGREPLRALAECHRDARGIDMFSSVILDFGRGRHAVFAVSLAQASAQSLQVVCERACIDLPKAYVPSRTEPNLIHIDRSQDHAKSDLTTLEFAALDHYEAEVTNFSRAVRGETVPFYGLDDARASMAAVDAIFESARTGAWAAVEGA